MIRPFTITGVKPRQAVKVPNMEISPASTICLPNNFASSKGMIDIYSDWIKNFDIAGFRLDTVKHVNKEFWQRFIPAIQEAARNSGRKDFFIFGEVYDHDPAVLSEFVHRASMPSVLDFGFQRAVRGFAAGTEAPAKLAEFFAKDSYYTTQSVNAYGLVTFLGNHDIGRIGYFLCNDVSTASDEELLARDILAHAVLFFTRGIPAMYYGDEQVLQVREGTWHRERICLDQRCLNTLRKSGSAGEMAQRRRSTKIIHCFAPFAQ